MVLMSRTARTNGGTAGLDGVAMGRPAGGRGRNGSEPGVRVIIGDEGARVQAATPGHASSPDARAVRSCGFMSREHGVGEVVAKIVEPDIESAVRGGADVAAPALDPAFLHGLLRGWRARCDVSRQT